MLGNLKQLLDFHRAKSLKRDSQASSESKRTLATGPEQTIVELVAISPTDEVLAPGTTKTIPPQGSTAIMITGVSRRDIQAWNKWDIIKTLKK